MLHFFRRFQKYIFIVITIVIIISFSFFGTYSNMQSREQKDNIVFTTVDGTKIYHSELIQFVNFLSTDSEDKRNWGGAWGPNFFNDGVIKKDFIETGMIIVLAKLFPEQIKKEIQEKFIKEKKFKLYSHPQAKFLNTEGVWKFAFPKMSTYFAELKGSNDPLSDSSLFARNQLFLSERQFPAPFLRYMLMMQEKQYQWLEHDPTLDYADLSLFGYHKVEDWYGPSLMNLMAEFIINSAAVAKNRGYTVSKEETLADLKRNALISFKQNEQSPHLNASNVDQYMKEQLRLLNLDENGAIKIWSQVLLFRKLFRDMGNSIFIDPNSFQIFDQFASEGVKGTLFQLPEAFQFHDSKSLAKFETYLDIISSRSKNAKDKIDLPKTFNDVKTIQKNNPELIQKRYLVEIAEVNKKDLQSKVTLKEMWKWQVDDKNWSTLENEFPELGLAKATTPKERKKTLDDLDSTTKSRVNKFSRNQIVLLHPEWITEALNHSTFKTMTLNIPLHGGKIYLKGNIDRQELISFLDAAGNKSDQMHEYTADNENFYRIKVIEKSPEFEIMTYSEANELGILDDLVNSKMKKHYETIRNKHPEIYQNSDKSWKNFTDVSDSVIGEYYGDFIKALGEDYVNSMLPKDDNKNLTLSRAASLRFIKYASNFKSSQENGDVSENEDSSDTSENGLKPREAIDKQWKFLSKPYEIKRNSENPLITYPEIAHIPINGWSKIYTPVNGDIYFFHIEEPIHFSDRELIANQVLKCQEKNGDDSECTLCLHLATEMKMSGALTLNFLYKEVHEKDEPLKEKSNES